MSIKHGDERVIKKLNGTFAIDGTLGVTCSLCAKFNTIDYCNRSIDQNRGVKSAAAERNEERNGFMECIGATDERC